MNSTSSNDTKADLDLLNVYILGNILLPSLIYVFVLLVIGVPGNILTVYVYGFKWKKTTSRVFILALASLDSINCLSSIPTEIVLLVNFVNFDFPAICKISRFLTYVFNFSSSMILTAIAFDRYRRICQPYKVPWNQKQGKIVVCSCIVIAILTGSPALVIYGTQLVPVDIPDTRDQIFGKTCLIENSMSHTKYPLIFYLWLLMTLFAMDIILIVIYSLIGKAVFQRKIRRESLKGSSKKFRKSLSSTADNCSEADMGSRKSKSGGSMKKNPTAKDPGMRTGQTTVMLFLVTLVFIVSFVPFTILVIIRFINLSFYDDLNDVDKSVYHVFLRSYFLNSALNPLVYCFVSKQFRIECKKAIMEDFICCRKNEQHITKT